MTKDVFALPFLPRDVWIQIVSFLDENALALAFLGQTCRRLQGIVKTYSTLYPRILSTLLLNSRVDKAGIHVSINRLGEPMTLNFNALECWESVSCLRHIIPNVCFEAAIRLGLSGAPRAETKSIPNFSLSYVSHFYRTSPEYDHSLLHKVGHFSLAEDCVDFVFDLPMNRVETIKSTSCESSMIGLRLKDVLSAALENLEADDRLFHSLQAAVMQRQRIVDKRSRQLQAAARMRSVLYPNRRHTAERMFATGKWTEEYSLAFLRQCQVSIAEEMREQKLHCELRARAKMSLSPYSRLSAKYISGDLADLHGMTDTCALDFTIARLQEIEFAHRNTIYNALKRAALVRGSNAERTEPGCGRCFWGSPNEVIALFEIFLGAEGSSEQFREMTDSETEASEIMTHESLVLESTAVGHLRAKRRRLNVEHACTKSDAATNMAPTMTCLKVSQSGGHYDDDSEWYVVESHDDEPGAPSTTFYIDDWFDATPIAVDVREWSLFLYACKVFVQHDTGLSASDNSTPENEVPESISVLFRDMLRWVGEVMEIHKGLLLGSASSRQEFVLGLLRHSLTHCDHDQDKMVPKRGSSTMLTDSRPRLHQRGFLSTMTRGAISYRETMARRQSPDRRVADLPAMQIPS